MSNLTLQTTVVPPPTSGSVLGEDFSWVSLVIGVAGVSLALFTSLENASILFVIARTPSLRTASNALICSLAVADLLIGAVSMNVYTLYSVLGVFPFGRALCKTYIWVDFTVWSASLSSLAMIMIDRYLSLQINSRYKDPSNHTCKIVLMLGHVWVTSSVVWLWGVLDFEPSPDSGECYFLPKRGAHMVVSALTTVYSPLLIITALCYAISKIVKSHSARAKTRLRVTMTSANQMNGNVNETADDNIIHVPDRCRYRRSSSRILSLTCRRILNREKKALRLLMAFVITFYLCITPYYVTYFLLAVDPDLPPKWLLTFSYWSGYFNSTVNPILYNIFNDDFRKAFKPAFTGQGRQVPQMLPPVGVNRQRRGAYFQHVRDPRKPKRVRVLEATPSCIRQPDMIPAVADIVDKPANNSF